MVEKYTYQQDAEPRIIVLTSGKVWKKYLEALSQAEDLIKEHGGFVPNVPQLISELRNAGVMDFIKKAEYHINTSSAEYFGNYNGDRTYVVGHSLGPLTNLRILRQRFINYDGYNFSITPPEFEALMKEPQMMHIDDIKKGAGTINLAYGIFAKPDKDKLTICDGLIDYEDFMRDDLILMRAGGEEQRNFLAKLVFDTYKERLSKHEQSKGKRVLNDRQYTLLWELFSGNPLRLEAGVVSDGVSLQQYGNFAVIAPNLQNPGNLETKL
ncbi:hypothetical protein HYX03_03855 [Candidatus Woesearchaeota archaeon]|nr:hypothetical protein [Candidatus Woesearchaeota archaeon]